MRCWFPVVLLFTSIYPLLLSYLPDELSNESSFASPDKSKFEIEEKDTFAACLLVLDDNHRLIEWLAYHYYSLNLRHVIIAVDPSSTESPSSVLGRWKSRITYELWSDGDFMDPEEFLRKPNDKPKQIVLKHRHRQNAFFSECIRQLRDQNRTWTAFLDPDEYVNINGGYKQSQSYPLKDFAQSAKPGRVVEAMNEANNLVKRKPTDILRFHFGKDCIVLPRVWYGSQESLESNIQALMPPALQSLDPRRLDTMRWRYRSTKGSVKKLGKSLIDVSRVKDHHFQGRGNAHRPLFDLCNTSNPFVRYDDSPILINHYLGSWEQYNYRNDSRNQNQERSYDVWRGQSKDSVGTDDNIRPWLQGFVDYVGVSEAKRLLQGAGLAPRDNHTLTEGM